MGYVISPGCTGPDGEALALAAMDDGSIVVQDAAEVTVQLLWSLVYDVFSGGFAMVSQNSVESGNPAVLGLLSAGGGTSPLTLIPFIDGLVQGTTWDVASGGKALAVRPTFNSSLNLNVAGAGPYPPGTPVIAYDGWGGGQPNEIWTFTQMGAADFPWNYTFTPVCAPSTLLSATPKNPGGQLTLQYPSVDEDAGPEQLWAGQFIIDGTTQLGGVFVNQELSMWMRTTPNGGPVFCVSSDTLDGWSQWLVGPGPDPQTYGVRSFANQNLYLNVAGGGPYGPGSEVITWPWQGGAQNELWNVQFVPHKVT